MVRVWFDSSETHWNLVSNGVEVRDYIDIFLSEVSSCSSQLLHELKFSCCVLLSWLPASTHPPHWDGALRHSYRMSAPCSWTPESCANTNLRSWYTSQVFCYSNAKQASKCILEISHLMAFKLDPDFSQLSLSLKSTPLCSNHILGTAQVRTISIILY